MTSHDITVSPPVLLISSVTQIGARINGRMTEWRNGRNEPLQMTISIQKMFCLAASCSPLRGNVKQPKQSKFISHEKLTQFLIVQYGNTNFHIMYVYISVQI